MSRTRIDPSLLNNLSSSLSFSPTTNGIVGTTTNDNAAAGVVGEYVSSTIFAVNVPTSGNFGDATSISLTAGDWEVWVFHNLGANGANVTDSRVGISTSAGNVTPTFGDGQIQTSAPTAVFNGVGAMSIRMSLSGTTTVYYKVNASYTVAIPQSYGRIAARRMR